VPAHQILGGIEFGQMNLRLMAVKVQPLLLVVR
jgi:hypothetical protein